MSDPTRPASDDHEWLASIAEWSGNTLPVREARRALDEIDTLRRQLDALGLRNRSLAQSRAKFDRDNRRLRDVFARLVETIDEDDDNVKPYLDALDAVKEALGIKVCRCYHEDDTDDALGAIDMRDCEIHDSAADYGTEGAS